MYNGITYTNETVYYTYKIYSALTGLDPNFGPTMGGTLIKVYGDRFDSQAYCYLDGSVIKPIIINSTLMLCEAPSHAEGINLKFELEFNNDVYMTQTGLTYSYYNDI